MTRSSSLVFLPPPSLSLFPFGGNRYDASSHTRIAVDVPVTRHLQISDNGPQDAREHEAENEEVVPDSVDPHLPLPIFEGEEEEESIAVSVVEDAPEGVPWELLHGAPPQSALDDDSRAEVEQEQSRTGRPSKRVRITSPVLVIETPTRPLPLPCFCLQLRFQRSTKDESAPRTSGQRKRRRYRCRGQEPCRSRRRQRK